ncbi:uncharacterized protein [Venturia canescens]|uniref:uncharacterized protein n=1 Tax=Venturia canescens TaxID=32260 RepID=UPI001C9D40E7|nr:uncharacterized protein LOC122416784 [Venturia canescens]
MSLIEPTDTFGNREPPPKEENEQYLFLLEFFVYEVRGERLGKLNSMFFVPTRVRLKFLKFDDEEMSVTPVDLMFEPQSGIADYAETFNSGRSVMFAIERASVLDKVMDFTLSLTVEKKMPKDMRPDVLVGRAEVDMSKHFAALRKEMLQCSQTNYPPPKEFEGTVELRDDGRVTGSLGIYVRISGFGQSIVTEIETPKNRPEASSYVFKSLDKDDKQLAYDCRLIDPEKMDFCKDSEGERKTCQICMPQRLDCSPCEVPGGAGRRPQAPPPDEETGPAANETLKSLLHGKIFTRPWDPVAGSQPAPFPSHRLHRGREQVAHSKLPIQSSRGPPEPCGKAVVLKVSGLLDVEDADGRRKNPTVTLQSRSMEHDPDPEHDIFILRIGKKGLVGAGEKSDIQLEMRTPKGPERRPPVRYETREMQTDEYDEPPAPGQHSRLSRSKKSKSAKKKNKKKKKKK